MATKFQWQQKFKWQQNYQWQQKFQWDLKNFQFPTSHLESENPFGLVSIAYIYPNSDFFFSLGTPSTSVPTSNPSCSTSSAVANASDLQLTDREKARLDELFMASRALVEPVEHERDVRNSIFNISSVGQG